MKESVLTLSALAEQKDIADRTTALKAKIDADAAKIDPNCGPILARIAVASAPKSVPKSETKPAQKATTATPSTNSPAATPPESGSTN